MGIGMVELVIVLIVVLGIGTIVVSMFSRLFRGRGDDSAPPPARGVTLHCPHCGGQTEASRHQCQHCSKDL